MSQVIKQEDGTEVEVFTKDEVDSERESALESYKKENPDQTDKVQELEGGLQEAKDALAKAEEDLKKVDEEDKNFAELRKQRNEAQQKLAEVTSDVDSKISEAKESTKNEILETVNVGHYKDTLDHLSGGSDDLKAKIEKEYNALNDPATNKGEITDKLTRAYTLATSEVPDALTSAVVSSGGATVKPSQVEKKTLSEDEKDLGRKLGLQEGDFNKYGGK